MEKRNFLLQFLQFCILCLCACSCFLAESLKVKADLILDNRQIDGSHTIYFGGQPLREIQYGGTVVWRAGAYITYVIDNNISETHFVPYGQTTLAVTGSKAGYEFAGWRQDQTASADILTADLCTGDAKTLYAVFRKTVTVSCCNGSPTPQTASGYLYYNNGNVRSPEFTIGQLPLSGWSARGWSTGQAADAGISYSAVNGTPFNDDVALYGLYQKNITASFDGNGAESGSVAAITGTAYFNSAGNTVNPAFPMPANGFIKSGNTWTGWLQGSTGITRTSGESVTLSSDTVFAAIWQPTVQNFGYTGNVQEWTVPVTGYYKLEAWGASGGTGYGNSYGIAHIPLEEVSGGPGGYACGYKYLTAGTVLYVCTGGAGGEYGERKGGFNGGTAGFENTHTDHVSFREHYICSGGGGGATHIATRAGLLENLEGCTPDILIAAGGGGGGLDNYEPDEDGEDDEIYGRRGGNGGTGIAPSSSTGFGRSRTSRSCGGGYYTGDDQAGGSSYIGGVMPSLTYNGINYVSTTAVSGHTGNGAATITYLGY